MVLQVCIMFSSIKEDAKAYIWIQGPKLLDLVSKTKNSVKPALLERCLP